LHHQKTQTKTIMQTKDAITVKTSKVGSVTETYKLVINGQRVIRIETRDLAGTLIEAVMRFPNGRPVSRMIEEKTIDFLDARDKRLGIRLNR